MRKLTTQEFIDKANRIHNNKYDYSKVNYIRSSQKVKIICKQHGEFKKTPNDHINGQGCKKCTYIKLQIRRKLTTQEFIDKANRIHNNKYDYSKVNYINNHTKIKIICPKHDEFLQTPNVHLLNSGCPKCSHTVSKGQIKWLNNLEKENNIIIERNLTIHIGNKYFYPDGFHKPTNTWYEYNGYYFHGHPGHYNLNDINKVNKKTFGELYQKTLEKEKTIKSAGYNLITKWGN